jgi:hypothetical protein
VKGLITLKEEGRAKMLGFLTTPSPGISYDFVVGAYTVCCLLGGALFALERVLLSAGGSEVGESIKGAWVIFVPFAPCLLWASFLRGQQQKLKQQDSEEGKMKKS